MSWQYYCNNCERDFAFCTCDSDGTPDTIRCHACDEAIPPGAGGLVEDEGHLCGDCFSEWKSQGTIRAEMADTERRVGNLITLLDLVAGGRKAS